MATHYFQILITIFIVAKSLVALATWATVDIIKLKIDALREHNEALAAQNRALIKRMESLTASIEKLTNRPVFNGESIDRPAQVINRPLEHDLVLKELSADHSDWLD